MGENKHIEELDSFAKKYLKEIKSEKTTLDFTATLMRKIEKIEIKSVYKSTPLISKKVWVLILLVFLSLFFIPFSNSNKEILKLPELDLSFLSKFQISDLLNTVSVSNTTFYTFLFFGIMIFIQILFLKNHFNKKFS